MRVTLADAAGRPLRYAIVARSFSASVKLPAGTYKLIVSGARQRFSSD